MMYIFFAIVWFSFRDPEKVHELMEDITEQNDTAREISETLAHPVGFAEDFDEVCRTNMFQLAYDWVKCGVVICIN